MRSTERILKKKLFFFLLCKSWSRPIPPTS